MFLSIALVGVAGLLRWLAGRDDLWLDEIWSWWLVQTRVQSALDVLLTLRHESNHFLNTWWILLLGPDVDGIWYRLPAIVLGSLTVLLARRAVAKAGPMAVGIVTVLTLPSYLLVHYSSEARGYAYQIFFSLAAYLLLERLLHSPGASGGLADLRDASSRRDRWLFAAACVLGCLGHPGFLMMFLALAGWAVAAVPRTRESLLGSARWLSRVFLPPSIALLALWLINLSRLENGGGPKYEPWIVSASTLSLTVGGPELGVGALIVGASVLAAGLVELWHLQRARDDRWICWGLMLIIPPILVAVLGREEIYPRYFLGTVIILDLALAQLLARWANRGRIERTLVFGLLGISLLGNGLHLTRLFRDGRGHASQVVKFLGDETPNGPITIGSDVPQFRHERLLEYFGNRLGLRDRIQYLGRGPWPPEGPRWLLLHHQGRDWPYEDVIRDARANTYALRRLFPYAGLSGWQTGIYENTKHSQ